MTKPTSFIRYDRPKFDIPPPEQLQYGLEQMSVTIEQWGDLLQVSDLLTVRRDLWGSHGRMHRRFMHRRAPLRLAA